MGSPQTPDPGSHPGGGVCAHCGSHQVIAGLKVNQSAEVGRIGLAYRTALIFVGTEQLFADLCGSCGSVVRWFVKDPARNWIQ